MAVHITKIFTIRINRHSQSPFIIFREQKDINHKKVKQAQKYIEIHFTEKLTVNRLAEWFSIGRRAFETRFKKATSNIFNEYFQWVRIETTKKLLEED